MFLSQLCIVGCFAISMNEELAE